MFSKSVAGFALVHIVLYQNMQTDGLTVTYNNIGLAPVFGGSVLKRQKTR